MRHGADEYAAGVLGSLEAEVTHDAAAGSSGAADARRAPRRLPRGPGACARRRRGRRRCARGRLRRRGAGRGRGSLAGRSAMTGAGPHGYPVDTHGDPLTFAVSGLMAEPPGTVRDYVIEGRGRRSRRGHRARRRRSTAASACSRTNRGLIVAAKLTTAMAGECARCLRPVRDPARTADRRGGPAVDRPGQRSPRPARGGRRPGRRRASPTTTSWSCGRWSPRRSASRSRSRPCASPTARACARSAAQRLEAGHVHDDGPIDPRLEALRAFRFDAGDESG